MTGFSTSLASLHLFQGSAKQFLSDPANGVRDLYGRAQFSFRVPMISDNTAATVTVHSFRADAANLSYGDEWDGSL